MRCIPGLRRKACLCPATSLHDTGTTGSAHLPQTDLARGSTTPMRINTRLLR